MRILLENIIFQKLDALKIMKISFDTYEGEINKEITEFCYNKKQEVFVLIANMQDLTVEMVNYLRLIIEQKERGSNFQDKLFVLLLHFPQVQFFNRCYPALFLNGWDHFYLDSLTTDIRVKEIRKPLRNVVDIKQCFCIALDIAKTTEAFCLDLEPLLEVAIPVISSRVIIGSGGKVYNRTISVSARQELLKNIFIKEESDEAVTVCTPMGKAFCALFNQYWDEKTVIKFLQDAANFTFHHQSTLSITSYIQTRIKALFFEFIIYVLWLINQDCNMDTFFLLQNICSFEVVQKLFADVIKMMSYNLESLETLPKICRTLAPVQDKNFRFPFFSITYQYMEELIDGCHETLNKKSNVLSKDDLEKEMLKEARKKLSSSCAKPSDHERFLVAIVSSITINDLWQCYFHDFIKHKCTQSDTRLTDLPEEIILSPVISTYFNFEQQNIKKEDHISHVAWLHIHSNFYKTDLNQIIEKLKGLKCFIKSKPHGKILTIHAEKNLETIIIEGIDASLCDEINNPFSLRHWYRTYKNIVRHT